MIITIIITPTTPPITPPYRPLDEDSGGSENIPKQYNYKVKKSLWNSSKQDDDSLNDWKCTLK